MSCNRVRVVEQFYVVGVKKGSRDKMNIVCMLDITKEEAPEVK